MAIAPTGNLFKCLEFAGDSSRNYGVYITGEAVYNAPERAVEMITIPNRNGSFALDQGRFENIEVTYPAGIFADNELDFAKAISDFRNFLCSKKGYCRLTDDYNPGEYRMAIYKSGLDVTPTQLKAGQFEITFDCMPQRYLMSGEADVAVSSGNTILNPTLFESNPMLKVWGYGSIGINDEPITISNSVLGVIQVSQSTTEATAQLDLTNVNSTDKIFKNTTALTPNVSLTMINNQGDSVEVSGISVTNGSAFKNRISNNSTKLIVSPTIGEFQKNTYKQIVTTVTFTLRLAGTPYNVTYTVTTTYNSAQTKITLNGTRSDFPSSSAMTYKTTYEHPAYYADSTLSLLPTPMYIDLDVGEAYGEINGELMSFNNLVTMPAKLPTLKVGNNTITFDNTITSFKVVPRWWKI